MDVGLNKSLYPAKHGICFFKRGYSLENLTMGIIYKINSTVIDEFALRRNNTLICGLTILSL